MDEARIHQPPSGLGSDGSYRCRVNEKRIAKLGKKPKLFVAAGVLGLGPRLLQEVSRLAKALCAVEDRYVPRPVSEEFVSFDRGPQSGNSAGTT
jgi:hypothetical protein